MKNDFARRQMVQQQVRAWDVLDDDVLEVLGELPREKFVPRGFEALAFADTEIPLGHGQSMMTPTVEGRILQALHPASTHAVLEVGTGSGFLSACLAQFAASVTSIDIFDEFLESAASRLEDTGIDNVELMKMDATRELPEQQFDVVAITGSIATFDPRYVMALKPGGRLFVIVGEPPIMDARLVERVGENDWHSRTLFETSIAPLVNAGPPPRFTF
ncbi:MAG: protein-L-isoaspartate O-methyltransferase [Woeseiaceae bacterium]|nr:protein-L-isoaspartate O-methyltransferase [Woeseiaceae bacterium]